MPYRIVLFEDNSKLRESLVFLLNNTGELEVVGDYGNCNQAENNIKETKPDLVLMDIDMPGDSGITGVKKVKAAKPDTIVLIYTVFEDDDTLFKCLCAGANGYLLKKTNPSRLFDAINDAMQGGAPMSPGIAKRVLATFHTVDPMDTYQISAREMDVLKLLSLGYTIKMIAAELYIAFDTVRSHLKNIYAKLHVTNGREAVNKAIKEKLL